MFDPSSQGRSRAALASASRWGAGLADRIRPRLNAWRDEAQEAWSDPRRRRRALTWGAVFSILSLAIIVLVAVWDWDWFRGPIARYASARTGREVQITGHLEVHPFSWTPSAAIGGLQVGNPAWMKTGKRMVDLGRTTVQIKLLPLLKGQTILPLVDIEHPNLDLYRDRKGRANWQLGQASGTPAKLPVIQHFILRDGRIRIVDDQRRARFEGVVTTSEGGPATGQPGFRIDGWGALNGAPFRAHVTGDPLIGVKRDVPYPFRAEVRA
ncbi:MAG: AsmA family protein, partial [Caulobacteraceae bacterium]